MYLSNKEITVVGIQLNISVFNALSIGGGLVAAVSLICEYLETEKSR